MPIFLSLSLLLVGFLLDVSSIIYAKNFLFNDSCAVILIACDENCVAHDAILVAQETRHNWF